MWPFPAEIEQFEQESKYVNYYRLNTGNHNNFYYYEQTYSLPILTHCQSLCKTYWFYYFIAVCLRYGLSLQR